jgi:predicted nucleotidyltransferase
MPLPEFNSQGDLPEGLHRATLAEVLERFGRGSQARRQATAVLQRIQHLVTATGKLERFVVFGSYITAKPEPHDVDIVLVMKDDFSWLRATNLRECSSTINGLKGRWGPAYFGFARLPFFVALSKISS